MVSQHFPATTSAYRTSGSPPRARMSSQQPARMKTAEAIVPITLPKIPRTQRPLQAHVTLNLRESGGRSIERKISLPVIGHGDRIGVRPNFKDGKIGENETAEFSVITVSADNERIASRSLTWEIVRLERTWQWYKRDGTWRYEALTIPHKVADGTINTATDKAVQIAAPVKWGKYRLDVQSEDGTSVATSIHFTAGWFASGSVDSPEMLPVALDKPAYRAGETAKLKITSRTSGTAMITVFANGLRSHRDVDIVSGDNEVAVPVAGEWGSGAYVVATLYRNLDKAQKRMPGRALGLAWLSIDQSARTMTIELETPDIVRSGQQLTIPITLNGIAPGEPARITVAAVDVGVLNLTRFPSPNPAKWFYAQPRLATEIRDFYGQLIDGMRAERGTLRSGGDADTSLGQPGQPPVEETVALFSGLIAPDKNGKASVTFDIPDFNGKVRLMAVSWSKDKLGSTEQDIIVRDKLAVTTTAPRFLTMGDKAVMQIDLHNVEAPQGDFKLTVARTAGPGQPKEIASRTINLVTGGKTSERITLEATEPGLLTYDIFITGPDAVEVKRDLIFTVHPPAHDIRRTTVAHLKPGDQISISRELAAGMIPNQTKLSVNIGPTAALNVPALLTALDRYPHGCAEQTTSRALPLLYANALAATAGVTQDKANATRIQSAIDRLFAMQNATGAFGVWGPSNPDIWLTSYVMDFLTRARNAGYKVDERGFNQALDRLQNYISYVNDFARGGEKRAYALFVLARNARAPIGDLRYYVDARLERFATPMAQAQLGAALAMIGDKKRAERAFSAAFSNVKDLSQRITRADFGSSLRDGAAVLTLAAESKLLVPRSRALMSKLATAFADRRVTSTQEQAWLLLAARGIGEHGKSLKLAVNGASRTGRLRRTLSVAELNKQPLTIRNISVTPTNAVMTVTGAALAPEPATANGLTVTREYYTLDGTQVVLKDASPASALNQNDRLVTVLKISASKRGGRLLLEDRLPAGLEIENPRLLESADLKSLSWLKVDVYPEHTEFRDDRFIAAFDFFKTNPKNRSATLAYIVRAVSPGTFVHPAAQIEDMYRPELNARTSAGTIRIKPAK